MAIFPRRVLQRILNENAAVLKPAQIARACSLLNTIHENYFGDEWEQVIINAAAKVGVVEHEPPLGRPKIDVLFKSINSSLEFLADVTAVSDKGLHEFNPVYALQDELYRIRRKRGLFSGAFDVYVDSYPERVYRGSKNKPRLKLPKKSDFHKKIFNENFRSFLDQIERSPTQPCRFDVMDQETGVHFEYRPGSRFATGSYGSFDFANIVDSNPVFNALKSKADQMKATGYAGIKGIFLCDGGSRMLRSRVSSTTGYNLDEILSDFLRQNTSVAFVVVLAVHDSGIPVPGRPGRLHIESQWHLNRRFKRDSSELFTVISEICRSLPSPVLSPATLIRRGDLEFGRKYGALHMNGRTITISLREMQEILAGRLTVESFEEDYKFEPGENPFKRMLAQGRLITNFEVNNFPDKDDDTVTITFGDPDPAIAPYSVPELK